MAPWALVYGHSGLPFAYGSLCARLAAFRIGMKSKMNADALGQAPKVPWGYVKLTILPDCPVGAKGRLCFTLDLYSKVKCSQVSA